MELIFGLCFFFQRQIMRKLIVTNLEFRPHAQKQCHETNRTALSCYEIFKTLALNVVLTN